MVDSLYYNNLMADTNSFAKNLKPINSDTSTVIFVYTQVQKHVLSTIFAQAL